MFEAQHWQQLFSLAAPFQKKHLRQLLSEGGQTRIQQLQKRHLGFLLDLTRQRLDQAVLAKFSQLLDDIALRTHIEDLFQGAQVNRSEQRPALHTALRQRSETPVYVEGENILPAVRAQWQRMDKLIQRLYQRQWRGYSGRAITDIVHMGVGGSELGPHLVVDALAEYRHPACPVRLHFVANLDGGELQRILSQLNPETTLFVVVSKTFTTLDTMANAQMALAWLQAASGRDEAILKHLHFVGVSAQPDKMTAWGIPPAHQLRFWSWVGGRYSLWSAVGFVIAVWLGMEGFMALLEGADAMDQHYRHAPWLDNLPVLLAMIGVWNHNVLDLHAHAVLPYDYRLQLLPRYLMQLEMESNGKSVTQLGEPVEQHTCPVLWGELGPNAQHAFYQLLHQGTEAVSCEFLAAVKGAANEQQQTLNLANCLAQMQVLASGREGDMPAQNYPGNHPASLLLMDALTPWQLGALLALYEHKVYTQAVIWGVNPFDQWGVELGKQIAQQTLSALQGEAQMENAVTAALVNYLREQQK